MIRKLMKEKIDTSGLDKYLLIDARRAVTMKDWLHVADGIYNTFPEAGTLDFITDTLYDYAKASGKSHEEIKDIIKYVEKNIVL